MIPNLPSTCPDGDYGTSSGPTFHSLPSGIGTYHLQADFVLAISRHMSEEGYQCALCQLGCASLATFRLTCWPAGRGRKGNCSFLYSAVFTVCPPEEDRRPSPQPGPSNLWRGDDQQPGPSRKRSSECLQNHCPDTKPTKRRRNKEPEVIISGRKRTKKSKHLNSPEPDHHTTKNHKKRLRSKRRLQDKLDRKLAKKLAKRYRI
ncbi:uncharacterized protein LOC121583859 [Coregonus clupeaformis]|uniref:uncharacterized protein LOC121583859 n=1 Tax=Coregonus clupeaformis TaxID=59861 RepID=UPI001BDF9896|nr:uncharacterized protein LOC121583859 [Coregonus clupeaformis]